MFRQQVAQKADRHDSDFSHFSQGASQLAKDEADEEVGAAEFVREREFLLQLGEVAHEPPSHDGQIERDVMLVTADDAKEVELVPEEDLVVTRFELVHEIVDHSEHKSEAEEDFDIFMRTVDSNDSYLRFPLCTFLTFTP